MFPKGTEPKLICEARKDYIRSSLFKICSQIQVRTNPSLPLSKCRVMQIYTCAMHVLHVVYIFKLFSVELK